jgi:hypothetical protein
MTTKTSAAELVIVVVTSKLLHFVVGLEERAYDHEDYCVYRCEGGPCFAKAADSYRSYSSRSKSVKQTVS